MSKLTFAFLVGLFASLGSFGADTFPDLSSINYVGKLEFISYRRDDSGRKILSRSIFCMQNGEYVGRGKVKYELKQLGIAPLVMEHEGERAELKSITLRYEYFANLSEDRNDYGALRNMYGELVVKARTQLEWEVSSSDTFPEEDLAWYETELESENGLAADNTLFYRGIDGKEYGFGVQLTRLDSSPYYNSLAELTVCEKARKSFIFLNK